VQTIQNSAQAEDAEQLIGAMGGERLAGSGFEDELPETGYAEAEE
jgi:hypothetical protein